ncbi:unnamed protein product [Bursaphelenchus xylophilus]|uniref:(pine wood nematode) hypothetical protein n=1 Tax=Bursaphelenchus xylophilus TaxID=6326 RepID=A0A1I7RZ73_BURXY|nr:unnamed protein product [Bursaphelenchus xylophilus]CAG9106781.1 unnamed protein product [Bursaphelenchus xylophilus]
MVFAGQMDEFNRRWGFFISRHPWSHIVFSLFMIAACGVWIKNLRIELDIRVSFSPTNSKAAIENKIYKEFFNLTASPQRSFILLSAKDGGSVLRPQCLKDILKLDKSFSGFLHEIDGLTGLRQCDPLCNLNRPFHLIADHLLSENTSRKGFLLDFPSADFNGIDVFVGMNLAGATVSDNIFPQNNSKITSVKTIILWYFARADSVYGKRRLSEKTSEIFLLGQQGTFLENVKFEIFGDEIANKEMVRGAIEATVLMSIGFGLLSIFVTATVYHKIGKMSKVSVPIVVFASVLCPFLGCVAAFGLCTLLGFPTYTIMCVVPFLVQGVGVDDAFLILQSWSQHRSIKSLDERTAMVFAHVGPSITITSLTNTIAFGIGFFTPTPQMSLFCLCTSFALLFDYILTFTMLTPVICLCTPTDEKKDFSPLTPALADSPNSSQRLPRHVLWYSKFICSTEGRVIAIILFIVMHIFAYWGVATMKSSFEPSKAFPCDSPLAKSIDTVRSVFNEFFPVNVIVNRPPNIENAMELSSFYEMVSELEHLPPSYGRNRTLLWLRAFEKFDYETSQLFGYLGYNTSNYSLSYTNLDLFLDYADHPAFIKTTSKNGSLTVSAFQFSFITKGQAEWANRAVTEQQAREIISRYPQFNATIYDGDSAILDLLLTVKMDLIGSMAVTVACMTIICSVFIHNPVAVALVAVTITSVCFTLVGLISWWGADLDPVTMVDVLLATGFSVDYTAHIAHQYYIKQYSSNYLRIAHSIHEMSGPMIQAGFSTVLCMLPLIFVPTYAIVAFAKTVFAVVGVGLLHGLFFLPIVVCWVPYRWGECFKKSRSELSSVSENPSTDSAQALLKP